MCWCIGAGFTWMVGSHQVSSLVFYVAIECSLIFKHNCMALFYSQVHDSSVQHWPMPTQTPRVKLAEHLRNNRVTDAVRQGSWA